MLEITIPADEFWDDSKQEFVALPEVKLELEHSLVSLSKWESSFKKAFLGNDEKTDEELLAYVKIMTLTPNVPPEVFARLTNPDYDQISDYINDKQSATWFKEEASRGGAVAHEVVTNEIIYYWMFSLSIDISCENWHLNRLFTLIRVFNEKNKPQKKMSRAELAQRNRELNAQRLAQMKTSG